MHRLSNKDWRRKGMAIMITALMLVFVIPIVGLAIDAGVLYAVKAKLSAASDASALAAARSLSVGLTVDEQEDTAIARANAFFDANFPDGTFSTEGKHVNVEVAETSYRTRTVEVTSEVDAPVYFMRVLGYDNLKVRTLGKASRRDVNVMLVIDRSSSLQIAGACDDLESAATGFVNQFANMRDRLGMITFGGSYKVDYQPAQNFKTSSPSLASKVGSLYPGGCNGWTGSAQALWRSYEEIVALNEPGALNVILFFTDGNPNTITADWPVKTDTTSYSPTGKSHCYDWVHGKRYNQYGWNPSSQVYRGFVSGDSTIGRAGVRGQDAASMPVSDDPGVVTKPVGYSGSSPSSTYDCYFRSNSSNVHKDIAYYPDEDLYGNSIFGYKSVGTYSSGPYAGHGKITDEDDQRNAAVNALDNAAQRIRNNELDSGIHTNIYVIGLGGVGAAEDTLLHRVANDADSPIYDTTQMQGLYVYAPSAAELNEAFVRIASEILRISQ